MQSLSNTVKETFTKADRAVLAALKNKNKTKLDKDLHELIE